MTWWLTARRRNRRAEALFKPRPVRPDSAAIKALLQWAAARWPDAPPRSLGALAGRVDDETAKPVRELERVRYAPEKGEWTGQDLWEVWRRNVRDREDAESPRTGIAPLYPDRR